MYLTPPGAVMDTRKAGTSASSWALIALAFLAPFIFFFDTARSIVSIWNSSETFAHGYIILPISLWLVWRRRANFSLYPPRPYKPALGLLLLAGAAWLLGRMGEVQVVQQYALAFMLPIIALAMFGPRLARSLAFPLLFVLFAVPFGEVFIAPLIEFTADFTVWAVQMTGIPVLRNGTRFDLPTGSWSVVEACSGIRYLISSVTLGSLYAYLTYHSTSRRVLFIALSILVPIIANGLRAYMIVMIGHTSGMTMAVGVDHLIYGWLFFGLVMFLMFWIGSFWREDDESAAAKAAAAAVPPDAPSASRVLPVALSVLLLCAMWPAFSIYNSRATFNPDPVALSADGLAWQPAPSLSVWKPQYMAADAAISSAFTAGAAPVGLNVLYYRNQDSGKKLISSINRLAGEHDAFHEVSSSLRTEQVGGRGIALRESLMRGPGGQFVVWHWMWLDGRIVTSHYVGKLLQARDKLLFRGDDGAAVMVHAAYVEDPDEARAALRSFLAANLAAIDASLERARGR